MSIVDVAVYSNYYPDIYSGLLNYDEMFQIMCLSWVLGIASWCHYHKIRGEIFPLLGPFQFWVLLRLCKKQLTPPTIFSLAKTKILLVWFWSS